MNKEPAAPPHIPAPQWYLADAQQSDACTVLGDYCETVVCVVRNIGDAAGNVRVKATLTPARRDGKVLATDRLSRIEPGGEVKETFRFTEAEMGGEYKAKCEAGSN